MIKCPECGKEISESAKSCPNCGCDVKKAIKKQFVFLEFHHDICNVDY